jgi:ADP-L-glycero-D-manno-heptose 6-epimerase
MIMTMTMTEKIVVTGAAGFIGSNIVKGLNEIGYVDLILVDREFGRGKEKNLEGAKFLDRLGTDEFLGQIESDAMKDIAVIVHMGANANTMESDKGAIFQNNTEYSRVLFDYCVRNKTRLIYASSAATYGDGSRGYGDDNRNLAPMNVYAESKHRFDEYVLDSNKKPLQWVGLKFFNVYGPGEEYKGIMASMIYHLYHQIKNTGEAKMFKSYKEGYADGCQKRDFVYVKDIVKIIKFFMNHGELSGIYNVGTGTARTFLDLARGVFAAMGREPKITFIDMPETLRGQYQYFTQADISKLRSAGYTEKFYTLEEGIRDYIENHLTFLAQ